MSGIIVQKESSPILTILGWTIFIIALLGFISWIVYKKPFKLKTSTTNSATNTNTTTSSNPNPVNVSDNAESIRGTFSALSTSTQASSQTLPNKNGSSGNNNSANAFTSGGSQTSKNPPLRSPVTTGPKKSGSVAGEYLYKNQELGLQITMPPAWAKNIQGDNTNITFYSTDGKKIGQIEVYENFNNISLSDIKATLQNNPNATSLSETTISGIPALIFSSPQPALSLIFKNKIYYFYGQFSNPIIRNSFIFF